KDHPVGRLGAAGHAKPGPVATGLDPATRVPVPAGGPGYGTEGPHRGRRWVPDAAQWPVPRPTTPPVRRGGRRRARPRTPGPEGSTGPGPRAIERRRYRRRLVM